MKPKGSKAVLLGAIIFLGLLVSVVFHKILSVYLGFNYYPRNTFLYNPVDQFKDFINLYNSTAHLKSPYQWYGSVYFPFTFSLIRLFTFFSGQVALGVYLAGFSLFLFLYSYKCLDFLVPVKRWILAGILSFLSYPFIFLFDRANTEGLVFVFLALGIHFQLHKAPLKSAIFLALAVSMKAYPGVFLILFLLDDRVIPSLNPKRWIKSTPVLVAMCVSVAVTLISFLSLNGSIFQNLASLYGNLRSLKHNVVLGPAGMQFTASYFQLLKLGLYQLKQVMYVNVDKSTSTVALLWPLAGLGITLWVWKFLYRYALPAWKRVSLLTFVIILLPQVSFDYKLIHLLIPILLFLRDEEQTPWTHYYTILFGLLLIPKAYWTIVGDASISVLINPLLMTVMVVGFRWEAAREAAKLTESSSVTLEGPEIEMV